MNIYLISKYGPEWNNPVCAGFDKKAAEKKCATLNKTLDQNSAVDRMSEYVITEIPMLDTVNAAIGKNEVILPKKLNGRFVSALMGEFSEKSMKRCSECNDSGEECEACDNQGWTDDDRIISVENINAIYDRIVSIGEGDS